MPDNNVWSRSEIESAQYPIARTANVYRLGCPRCGVSYMSLVPQGVDNGQCETCDKIAQARREQTAKDAAIVRNFEFNAGHQYTQEDINEQQEECARRIESNGQ